MNTPKSNRTDKIITNITAILASVILVALAVWGTRTLLFMNKYEETNDAQVDEYINPVTAKVSGYIKEIKFEENQEVHRGDTLLVIDNSDYIVQQREAEAALVNARAQISVLESNTNTMNQVAKVSKSQIEAAKARLWKQEQEYIRYKNLFEAESVTGQQFENVKTALDVAKSEYQATLDAYSASLAKVHDTQVQKDVASAEIKRREAIVGKNKLDVSYTIITAPYDGKMGRRTIQPGQLILIGQTLGFIVDHEAGKWVIANFKETQVRNMYVGENVEIEIDAFPDEIFKGKIESLSAATGSRFSLLPPDNSTGNFVKIAQRIPVRIRLEGDKKGLGILSAGMSANVSVKKGRNHQNG
ncbi:membrane fusion protein, multidrug efflux system [Pseudarcicella hirudinis]|uniref:Membrane fusion protein, multidrug efflux system n=1 Tax=Pseudarcicella hirudinis TaxID=1079859 RepID=A0A1I5NZI7_9BACT|nr:HlyD family secretion protein [Pseudarcicella hirudinis]SFP27020.1 membrane fusion protein, multidrug efflux system [Pseudarcicella hirudinis]